MNANLVAGLDRQVARQLDMRVEMRLALLHRHTAGHFEGTGADHA
ncbi:MAG: hypothetical protein VW935_08945 [Novosphingobium sp.]